MQIWSLERRWLGLSVDSCLANAPNIIGSCLVLHSICETRGDHSSDEWMVEEGSHNSGGGTSTTATAPGSTTAIRVTIEMMPNSYD